MNFDYFYGAEAEQFSFYRIPKVLVKDKRYKNISMEAKFLYGLMLDRMSLSMKNGWLNKENQVYIIYTLEDIKEDMNCGNEKGVKVIAELEKIGLITRKKQGQGKPTIIYVKNFIKNLEEEEIIEEKEKTSEVKTSEKPKSEKLSAESQDFRKTEVKISENQKSRLPENRSQDFRKSECNNTNNNYINNNYNNQSNQSSNNIPDEEMIDTIDDTTYAELVKENISYNSYMERLKGEDLELYKELYAIICEVITTNDETVRIGKHNYPYEVVKSQFLKLTGAHLEYVLECMKNTKGRISNIKAYLVTSLYNSVNTIQNYYQQKQNVLPEEEHMRAAPEKNKFINYEQRKWNFEELEKLEARLNDGIT